MRSLSRAAYAQIYGPTVGDRVRLADTSLLVEVEKDLCLKAGGPGEELRFGPGGSARDGMGQSQIVNGHGPHEAHDLVITNALIIDHWGVVKADIGIKGSRIAAIGKAGNPDIQAGVDIVIGPGTELVSGEGLIVTAGAVLSHARFNSPQQIEQALGVGVTTIIGGGLGPSSGSRGSGATPGPENLHRMLQAAEALPLNLGFVGKGSATRPEALSQQIAAGAIGLKLHGHWGTGPAAVDNCLTMAEVTDTRVSLEFDSLHESGFVDDIVAAVRGRSLACLHGAGADAATEALMLAGQSNFLVASTLALDGGDAEEVLHDLGALSILGGATLQTGDVVRRAWQTAHRMKGLRGSLAQDSARNDNFRVRRYLAKYTVNPALANGIAHDVGSIEVGKWADLVLWQPAFFGLRPSLVMKGGFVVAAAQEGASTPLFGGLGRVRSATSLSFISSTAMDNDLGDELGLTKRLSAVHDCRGISRKQMLLNDCMPLIEFDAHAGMLRADGQALQVEPATLLPLAQRYFLF